MYLFDYFITMFPIYNMKATRAEFFACMVNCNMNNAWHMVVVPNICAE